MNIAYLIKYKYNKITNDKNTDYLRISVLDIPFYIIILIFYWFLAKNNDNLSLIIIFIQIIVPMFLITLLQILTLVIFYKKQNSLDNYYSDYIFDV